MEFHEYANLFPMMQQPDLMRLSEDIKERGQSDRIVTLDGKILDGRNRYQACLINGITPEFQQYAGNDPLGFVISHNLHRRHLDESQRGMVAAKLANLNVGNPNLNTSNDVIGVSQTQVADMLNVSVPTVQRAKKVIKDGIPELQDMVDSGEVSAAAASEIAKLPRNEQVKAVSGGVAGVKDAAKKSKLSRASSKQQETDSEKSDGKQQEEPSSAECPQEEEEKPSGDSYRLMEAKRIWKKLYKKERQQFLAWTQTQN